MENYTLIRKNRKTVGLRLDSYGNLTVTAPLQMSRAEIDRCVSQKGEWIARNRERLLSRAPLPRIEGRDGEQVPLFGSVYTLRRVPGSRVSVRGDEVRVPEGADAREALKKLYSRLLRAHIVPLVAGYAQAMGVRPGRVTVGSARSRWGCCSANGNLRFSLYLAMCRPSAIGYVAVHELCHLRHMDHSRAFWDEVAKWCPGYRDEVRYLRERGYFLQML